jgi:hypothetical protein
LAKGWTGITLAVVVIIVVVLAVCWIINDADRPKRLALLLVAWRDTRSTRRTTPRKNPSSSSRDRATR